MTQYHIISQSTESTVVGVYESKTKRASQYESEEALERAFIEQLEAQQYERLTIHSHSEMVANLRQQLERLNDYQFTDDEWKRFYHEVIANPNEGIEHKTNRIQNDERITFKTDKGDSLNIALIDKKHIHENHLQVINQFCEEGGAHATRYDVTILVNGLPLVHVELKRRGVNIREAFNQINRYQRDSFWASDGLYEFVQLFVISNGTLTKYYSNTTRHNHVEEFGKMQRKNKNKTSHSFEFTSYWADAKNRIIPDLMDFTRTFFTKGTLLNILTKYCIFTSEKMLLVMRPYQIVATERILQRIEISNNKRTYGKTEAGGYIWHTTGSGKTLTSFKTAQITSKLDYIDKVLFVVDRKDLDYQTMKEYDRFEKGAANSNSSTEVLKRQLDNPNARIIITTIQKLSIFIKKNPQHPALQQRIVLIFDECHRSQFGELHMMITKHFKRYNIFGFTGTPIFPENAIGSGNLRTTQQAFGDRLHAYTIVDAINDHNVLPFKVDYIKTIDKELDILDKSVSDIDRDAVYLAPERIAKITRYILDYFNSKTYRNSKYYSFNKVMNISGVAAQQEQEKKQKVALHGFNSILCTSSIPAAKLYYTEFQKQMQELTPDQRLKTAIIYSYGINEDEAEAGSGIIDDENNENTDRLDQSSRDFLEAAIADYNKQFGTQYDTSAEKFQNYYKDLSLRMKNREIDLLIVVNMFLTGFDATTLNTLWVDKNLRLHGLIQAFSRTNRILNSVKQYGNIVCFRNLQQATDEAISLFGDKDAGGICILRSFSDYYFGFDDNKGKHHWGYKELVDNLLDQFPLSEMPIASEQMQKEFITLFGNILRSRNLLSTFDDFAGLEILSDYDRQDYTSYYTDLYEEWKQKKAHADKESIIDDVVFEVELVRQIEVNIDYILLLVKQYHEKHCQDMEILVRIKKAMASSLELRSKRELVEQFVSTLNEGNDDIYQLWRAFVQEQREQQLTTLIQEERLNDEKTRVFVNNAFAAGTLKTTGTDIDGIMPPMSRFGGSNREEKKKTLIDKLKAFFERFSGLGGE